MTDRLDRIEASLERSEQRAEKRDEDIDTLLGVIATTEANVQNLTAKATDTDQLFETLRAEAQADRQETRQLWNDAVTQMEADRAESRERFDAAMEESRRRFDAQQENIQRLFVELINVSRDNSRLRDRVDNLEQAS